MFPVEFECEHGRRVGQTEEHQSRIKNSFDGIERHTCSSIRSRSGREIVWSRILFASIRQYFQLHARKPRVVSGVFHTSLLPLEG